MEILKETLNWKYNIKTSKAYIITIKDHENSEKMAARCMGSCQKVGQPAEIFDAFDGTGRLNPDIIVPEHSRNKDWVSWLKLVNKTLSKPEVCCFLSHFALWVKCVEEDQPLIALEHDAVMLRPFPEHMAINALVYLGSNEMVRNNYWNPIPPHAQLCPDYRYILRTHAYSVDPICAKNLISDAIEKGIYTAVDVMMNIQKYSILCFGIYAMDLPGESTIPEAFVDKCKLQQN
jgi:GR25 family glycosyltransferase involved in LPS biosynthesis